MPDDPQTLIAALTTERSQDMDAQIQGFEDALTSIAHRWNAEITALLSALPSSYGASRLQELTYLQAQIQSQLDRLGYPALAAQFVSQYDDAQQSASTVLTAMGIEADRVAPLDQDALSTLRAMDLNKLVRTGSNASYALSEGIVQNAISGLPKAKLIENVEHTLGAFKNYATGIVNTGLTSYDRFVTWGKFEQVTNKWQYFGVRDISNRAFCAAHIGNVYTTEEIDRMDNGTSLGPVRQFCGGFNCKHTWLPFVGPPKR